ncbi:MAG TPA: TIGR02266 family protein [Kofleriaceae bacterium]|jgi:uncharacterized protein (TIGR02266 family)|nr:TIGR02266 family protein [Kofleriaceae bacterium]
MPRTEKHERRRHFRGKSRAGRRVDLRFRRAETGGDFVDAVTRNIGLGGAYILTDMPEPVGTRLEIEIRIPGGEPGIPVSAEVRWNTAPEDDEDSAGMGVRFAEIDVEATLRLSEYFATLTPQAE